MQSQMKKREDEARERELAKKRAQEERERANKPVASKDTDAAVRLILIV